MNKIKFGLIFFLLVSVTVFGGCSTKKEKFSGKKNVKIGDGGVYKSNDGGETWQRINKISQEKDLSNSSILDLAISPTNPAVIYAGTVDDGILRSGNGGQSWATSKSDFTYVRRILLDPSNENVLYIIARSGQEMAFFKTVDKGVNWKRLLLQRDQSQPIVLDALVDQKNPQIVYASDNTGGIYKSVDGGNEWRAIYWAEFPVTAMVMDSQDSNRIYFATNNEKIYVTGDGGKTFKTIQTDGAIYSLAVSQLEKGVLYVLYQGGLYVTRDGGETFQLLPTLLKPNNTVANIIKTDPVDKNILYLIAGKVLYKTMNGGQTWRAIPLKNIPWNVSQFEISYSDHNTIFLGTYKSKRKRGIFLGF